MVRVPAHRAPTHSGEILLEEFLIPLGLTQRDLAEGIQMPYQRINEVVRGRRGMSAGFWMNLQLRWDLYQVQQREVKALEMIKPFRGKGSSSHKKAA